MFCVSVFNNPTFESLDLESSFLVHRYILSIYRSSSRIKMIGWMSQEQKKYIGVSHVGSVLNVLTRNIYLFWYAAAYLMEYTSLYIEVITIKVTEAARCLCILFMVVCLWLKGSLVNNVHCIQRLLQMYVYFSVHESTNTCIYFVVSSLKSFLCQQIKWLRCMTVISKIYKPWYWRLLFHCGCDVTEVIRSN